MYYYNGYQCNIVSEFARNGKRFAVIEYESGDYTEHGVCELDKLQVWEKTWEYQQREKRNAADKELQDNHDAIVAKIKNEAMESLIFRLKLNTVFAKDEKMSEIGSAIVTELKKIIDDKKL